MRYLAVDVGGSYIKSALITETGIQELNIDKTDNSSLEKFEAQVFAVIQRHQATIDGIGFSIPGKVDNKTGILYHGGALPFLDGYPLASRMSQQVQVPIAIENDAKAACLAEWTWGNLKGTTSGLALVLGTAVGAGIISQGQLLKGPHSQAGEVSYLILDRHLASVESFAGTQGSSVLLITRLRQVIDAQDKSDPEIFALIEDNIEAQKILQDYCQDVAKMIFDLHVVLDFKKVVIGGGISNQPIVLAYLIATFNRIYTNVDSIQQTFSQPTIETAHFLSEANLFGSILPLISEKEMQTIKF